MLNQFANDTCLLEGDKNSYKKLFTTLDRFERISGLKLNYDKTCNVWLGSKRNTEVVCLSHLKMIWNPLKFSP